MTNTLTIDDMRQFAIKKGGWCLSEEYVNQSNYLIWKCSEGHVWEAKYKRIRNGSWCPICSRKSRRGKQRLNRTIDDMRQIAKDRGGDCLSETYINVSTKLLWKCKEGHTWEAPPSTIKKGSWCPICSRNSETRKQNLKLTIDDMRQIAKERSGDCLSDIYVNSHTKLLWQCKEGHTWEAIPSNIKKAVGVLHAQKK